VTQNATQFPMSDPAQTPFRNTIGANLTMLGAPSSTAWAPAMSNCEKRTFCDSVMREIAALRDQQKRDTLKLSRQLHDLLLAVTARAGVPVSTAVPVSRATPVTPATIAKQPWDE
jgi:hypothetical protein